MIIFKAMLYTALRLLKNGRQRHKMHGAMFLTISWRVPREFQTKSKFLCGKQLRLADTFKQQRISYNLQKFPILSITANLFLYLPVQSSSQDNCMTQMK